MSVQSSVPNECRSPRVPRRPTKEPPHNGSKSVKRNRQYRVLGTKRELLEQAPQVIVDQPKESQRTRSRPPLGPASSRPKRQVCLAIGPVDGEAHLPVKEFLGLTLKRPVVRGHKRTVSSSHKVEIPRAILGKNFKAGPVLRENVKPVPNPQPSSLRQSGTVDAVKVVSNCFRPKPRRAKGAVIEMSNGVLITKSGHKDRDEFETAPQTQRNPSVEPRRVPDEHKPFIRKALAASKSTPSVNTLVPFLYLRT